MESIVPLWPAALFRCSKGRSWNSGFKFDVFLPWKRRDYDLPEKAGGQCFGCRACLARERLVAARPFLRDRVGAVTVPFRQSKSAKQNRNGDCGMERENFCIQRLSPSATTAGAGHRRYSFSRLYLTVRDTVVCVRRTPYAVRHGSKGIQ
jgi:hypothetical protein